MTTDSLNWIFFRKNISTGLVKNTDLKFPGKKLPMAPVKTTAVVFLNKLPNHLTIGLQYFVSDPTGNTAVQRRLQADEKRNRDE